MKEYQDYYFRKAKAENYPARSIYKLQELDAKFSLLARDMRILDLGAAPGSWSLGASRRVGEGGLVLACDLKPLAITLPKNVRFVQEDVLSEEFLLLAKTSAPFDLVLSDMAPATSGNKFTDQARSANLVEAALGIAVENLAKGGNFAAKIFMGPDVQPIMGKMREYFSKVKSFKPKSSRSESYETFLVGLELKSS